MVAYMKSEKFLTPPTYKYNTGCLDARQNVSHDVDHPTRPPSFWCVWLLKRRVLGYPVQEGVQKKYKTPIVAREPDAGPPDSVSPFSPSWSATLCGCSGRRVLLPGFAIIRDSDNLTFTRSTSRLQDDFPAAASRLPPPDIQRPE